MDVESDDEDFLLGPLDVEAKTLVELDSKNETRSTKKKKKWVPKYDISGVEKVVLDANSQSSIGVKVGSDVTGLYPWKKIKKELLLDNVTVYGDESTLAPFKAAIESYEEEDILVGYIFDETRGFDEFYVCLTLEAMKQCEEIINKAARSTMRKLEKGVSRVCKPWKSLGSEVEVDDFVLKTSRPLIRVDINMTFPEANRPVRFDVRNPEVVRDGYSELVPSKKEFQNVALTRIDDYVQAVPEKRSSEAQTELKFPQNVWTQCSVTSNEVIDICETREDDAISTEDEVDVRKLRKAHSKEEEEHKQVLEDIKVFLSRVEPKISSMLKFNEVLDIYNLDYPALKTKAEEIVEDFRCDEIMFFKSEKAGDKVVSSLSWHRSNPKIFAVSYSETCHILTDKKPLMDQVYRDVHRINPVLAWSIEDGLKPKLTFGTERDIKTLSFCPFDEEILVGGSISGQVILWDMMGKLNINEDTSPVSETRKKFRAYLDNNRGWMKEFDDTFVVKIAASSDPVNNHRDAVSDIAWMGSEWMVGRSGKMLRDETSTSMQLVTVSLDSSIFVWDLKLESSDVETEVKSKRVQMNLSELGMSLSKYKTLDGNLIPIYKVFVGEPGIAIRSPLTSVAFKNPHIEISKEEQKDYAYSEPVEITKILHDMWLGSLYGDVYKVTWEGQESAPSGEELKPEYCKFDLKLTMHDGPITCCSRNPFFEDIFATVGGKVFAFWSDGLTGKPLFWRKMQYYLTHLAWSPHVPSQLFLTTKEGDVDIWEFTHRSDAPIKTLKMSGVALTGLYFNRKLSDEKLIVVGDGDGSLRLFGLSESCYRLDEIKMQEAKKFFDRAIEARDMCTEWQKKWYERHAEMIEKRKAEELAQKKERDRLKRLQIRKEHERQEMEEEKAKVVVVKEIDHAARWRRMQWKHASKTLQETTHLDMMKLSKQERPQRDHDGEKIAMSIKRLEILKRQELIFNETVSILFPEAMQKPPEPPREISVETMTEMKKKVMDEYKEIAQQSEKFIRENPHDALFDWKNALAEGKERRRVLTAAGNPSVVARGECIATCPLKRTE